MEPMSPMMNASIPTPTSRATWQDGIADVKKSLGIGEVPHCVDVFLPAVCVAALTVEG